MARIIPSKPPADQNRAEGAVREFLKKLPENCIVYQELRLNVEDFQRFRRSIRKQPDFIVVSPDLGLISIEVKDWNLDRNQYKWENQQLVTKTIRATGDKTTLRNPFSQAEDYLYALLGIMKAEDIRDIWVSSLVIFPTITQHAFLNKIKHPEHLKKAASKPLFNLDEAIFRDEMSQKDDPAYWIRQKMRRQVTGYPDRVIYRVHNALMPQDFIIGDITRKQREREQLKIITERQEAWIRNLDRRTNYLLDVAGSGKTNVLISKAIYLIREAIQNHDPVPKILLVSYSRTLSCNIEAIYEGKTTEKDRRDFTSFIDIHSFPGLMVDIAASAYDMSSVKYRKHMNDGDLKTFKSTTLDDVRSAIAGKPQIYRRYDYIFVDEIQDFADEEIQILLDLCRSHQFFFVGDIGQRLKQAIHDMSRQNIDVTDIELPKSYQMYRTPRYIAELAHRFVTGDQDINHEFEAHGYRRDAEFMSQLDHGAELIRTDNLIEDLKTRINDLIASGMYTLDDMLVITARKFVTELQKRLSDSGISSGKGYNNTPDTISVVSFKDSKGLEYEVVFISHIERLPHREIARFVDIDAIITKEALARRKIYVALTRTLEECIVYYKDNTHPFVAELLDINRKLLRKRREDPAK